MDRSSDTSEETCAESLDGPRVPPADGGKDAWLFLAGCFTIEMLLWGESPASVPFAFLSPSVPPELLSYAEVVEQAFLFHTVRGTLQPSHLTTPSLIEQTGVLQHYYSTHEPFASNPSGISAIGTTVTVSIGLASGVERRRSDMWKGIMYFGSPLAFASLMKWPRLRRSCTMMGFVVLLLALFLSSFAQEVWQLILLQGVLYGVGGSMAYCPCILFMDEWFVRRKGLAFGIMWVSRLGPDDRHGPVMTG